MDGKEKDDTQKRVCEVKNLDEESDCKKQKLQSTPSVSSDLAKVFFTIISKELLAQRDNRVLHLEKINDTFEKRLQFFDFILPTCMLDFDEPEDMYCADCVSPLTCCDWKFPKMLRDCSFHRSRSDCYECECYLCDNCVEVCDVSGVQMCQTCFEEHKESCLVCRTSF